MIRVSLAAIRAMFANAVCGVPLSATAEKRAVHDLRHVQLFPHQVDAVYRAREAIARFGGALLADDVGAGKTFVAIAIASQYSRPVVLAPAALKPMWTHAMAQTATALPFHSLESLGRGRPPPTGHDLVIIDEAHHVRNPATKRYAATQRAVMGARVLLASATPVHNVARDLDALLALFLRADAADLDGEARARVIIRSATSATTPAVHVYAPQPVPDDKRVINAIQRLPSPTRPSDGGDAPALLRISLMRAWCSSAAALDAMLVRAVHSAAALADALRSGRTLTRRELAAWSLEDGQLAFAELFGVVARSGDTARALSHAESHLKSLRALRMRVHGAGAVDDERARLLASVYREHSPTPMLACAHYAATVTMLWRRLRGVPGVALLTSHGARIASGTISRDDALRRFAPRAHGSRAPHARERISLLLATDLVSEGLNLQDAGVVVHLDLPWTAARMAQRVGRAARIGSAHNVVRVHSIAPPRAAAALLALERRIRAKRALGERLVGGQERMAALLGGARTGEESGAEARARIVQLLRPYTAPGHSVCVTGERRDRETRGGERRVTCAVPAPQQGWLALAGTRLVAKLGRGRPSTDPRIVVRAVEVLVGATEACEPDGAGRALAQVQRWMSNERARELSSANRRNAAKVHGRAIASTVGSVASAPAHERAKAAALAQQELGTLDRAFVNRQSSIAHLLALVLFSPSDQNRNSL